MICRLWILLIKILSVLRYLSICIEEQPFKSGFVKTRFKQKLLHAEFCMEIIIYNCSIRPTNPTIEHVQILNI